MKIWELNFSWRCEPLQFIGTTLLLLTTFPADFIYFIKYKILYTVMKTDVVCIVNSLSMELPILVTSANVYFEIVKSCISCQLQKFNIRLLFLNYDQHVCRDRSLMGKKFWIYSDSVSIKYSKAVKLMRL